MSVLPSLTELRVVIKSLVFMIGLSVVLWIPLSVVVALQHLEAVSFRMFGGAIDTSLLEDYDQAKASVFYIALGCAFALSQSAMWLVAVSKGSSDSGARRARVDPNGLTPEHHVRSPSSSSVGPPA